MALVSKLIQSGFARRQAQAIGFTSEELVLTGTNQSDAVQINESFTRLEGTDGNKGAILPTYDLSATGLHFLVTKGESNLYFLYPAVGEKLNLQVADSPLKIPAGSHVICVLCDFPTSGRSWFCMTAAEALP